MTYSSGLVKRVIKKLNKPVIFPFNFGFPFYIVLSSTEPLKSTLGTSSTHKLSAASEKKLNFFH